MSHEFIEAPQFSEIILNTIPIIDVRAPVEFLQGSIPNSVNLPLLNDAERHEIGIIYKEKGQLTAIERGHQLISGKIKDSRVQSWTSFLKTHPNALMTCFRGGLRSKISQTWAAEAGFPQPRIQGGYKAFRQFLLSELSRLSFQPMCIISGSTGCGKTLLIREIKKFRSTIDLELLAKHRGSAFGAYLDPQPTQINFENALSAELIKQDSEKKHGPLIVEDESRMIGKCAQPEHFFSALRSSGIILLEENFADRVQVIFDEYVLNIPIDLRSKVFLKYENSLQLISKKLGGLRYQEISSDFLKAKELSLQTGELEAHKIWIEKLLSWYYDPLYLESLAKRKPEILFRGSRKQALEFLT